MTDYVARLYALAIAILVFFLTWAVVAAHPWASESRKGPRLAALERREARLRRAGVEVRHTVERRFALYRMHLRRRQEKIAAIQAENGTVRTSAVAPGSAASAPSVSVVSLPPVTSTRTS